MARRPAGGYGGAPCRCGVKRRRAAGTPRLGNTYGASDPPLGAVVVVVVGGCVWVVVTVGGCVWVVVSVVVVVGSFGVVRVIVVVLVVLLDSSPPPVMSSAAITPATMIATPASTHGHGFDSRGGGGAPYPPCCG